MNHVFLTIGLSAIFHFRIDQRVNFAANQIYMKNNNCDLQVSKNFSSTVSHRNDDLFNGVARAKLKVNYTNFKILVMLLI